MIRRPGTPRSLRARLLFWTTAGLCGVVLVVGILLSFLLRSALADLLDRALLDKTRSLAAAVEQNPETVLLEFDDLDMSEFAAGEQPAYLQLWIRGGRELYRSPSLGGARLERIEGHGDEPEYRWLRLPDGRPGRAVGITFTPREEDIEEKEEAAREKGVTFVPSAGRVTLVLARDTSAIHEPERKMAVVLGSVGLLAVAIFLGLMWLIIHVSLRPLNRVAGEIARLDARDLSARVQRGDSPREIQPVIDRLNEFLGRLESAFLRERTLSADIAHEIRTPLAGIRSTIEVALSRLRPSAEYSRALQDCLDIAVKMQVMAENLMSLARLEAGEVRHEAVPLEAGEVLRAVWSPLDAAARSRALRVDWALAPGDRLTTDRTLLEVVLRNVLENAVEYADGGGQLWIGTAIENGNVAIRVRNTGSKLTPEEATRVFDRFWRGDRARGNGSTHCGLGMVLVKKITVLLGGDVDVRSGSGGVFEVTVTLPSRKTPPPP